MQPALHQKLERKINQILSHMRMSMIDHFTSVLPYEELQAMVIPEELLNVFQIVGKYMPNNKPPYTYYTYELEKINITFKCITDKGQILFPAEINYTPEFMDLIRPVYNITKSWNDVILAFNAICDIIQDTRELNFFVPWLKYIFPTDGKFDDPYNGKYNVTRWMSMGEQSHSTIRIIHHQINQIITNEYTSKRTWMPAELIQMARQGGELITQYNILKTKLATYKNNIVAIIININDENHPVIKWKSEAYTHKIMNEANRLREKDKLKEEGLY